MTPKSIVLALQILSWCGNALISAALLGLYGVVSAELTRRDLWKRSWTFADFDTRFCLVTVPYSTLEVDTNPTAHSLDRDRDCLGRIRR